MNKVTCNLCGTSYPENAAQCPICGEVRSSVSSADHSGSRSYVYVKGGRFSKANVKKRNRASYAAAESVVSDTAADNNKKKNIGLIAIIIILLLAIVSVLAYIAVQVFVPADLFNSLADTTIAVQKNEETQPSTQEVIESPSTETTATKPDLTCKKLTLDKQQVESDAIGNTIKLTATPDPANTSDDIRFSSSNESVATVSADGKITFTGEGSAVITVTCGSVKAECTVTCKVPETEETDNVITLNRKEITFNQEGQTWLLYSGNIPASDILWTSDDNDVVTIEDGKVTAVGDGSTLIYGIYDDQVVSCIIHCDFSETGDFGGITEAGGNSQTGDSSYALYNPYGYADDVTLFVGDQFTLMFVDENGNEVADAQWYSADESICIYTDGIVEAVGLGTSEIVATYEGVDYICTVRVIEP